MTSSISQIHAARRHALTGRAQDALALLDTLGDLEFATLHLVRGECHYALRQFEDATREFRKALELAPNSPRAEILLVLSSEMVSLGKSMRPPASITQLIGTEVEGDVGLPTLSRTRNGTSSTTTEDGERLDEIGLVSETLARIMERQGKFEDARKVYIQLSRLNPDRYDYFHARMEELSVRMRAEE